MTPSTNVLQIQPMLKSKAAHSIQKMASDFGEGNIDINNRYIPHLKCYISAVSYAILSNLDQLKFDNTNSNGAIAAAESTNERTYSNINNPAINDVTRVNNFVQQVR